MDVSLLLDNPTAVRALLPGFLSGNIANPEASRHTHAALSDEVARWTDEDCVSLVAHLVSLGDERRLYDAHPAARSLARTWSRGVLTPARAEGVEHLIAAADAGPTVLICNHLSYADSLIVDALLAWHDAAPYADRVFSAAGPKVYSDLFRRFAAGCVGTLPVPQSNSVGQQQLSPRELARRAIESLKASAAALGQGRILLIFAEGSRSRTGQLGPFLQGVSRYLRPERCQVVPTALVGPGQIMGVQSDKLYPGPVTLRFGAPICVADHGTKDVLPVVHEHVARLLPEHMRPA